MSYLVYLLVGFWILRATADAAEILCSYKAEDSKHQQADGFSSALVNCDLHGAESNELSGGIADED